jgi:DNA-binding MarR family transcriptional regulator
MSNRFKSEPLSGKELACLRYLSRHPIATTSPFSTQLLDNLAARGLVEKVRVLALPVVPQRYHYRLTPKGRKLLIGQHTR